MGQGARGLVDGLDGSINTHALVKVLFGIRELWVIVAVVKAAILFVVKMRCPLSAPLCERYITGRLSTVTGDGVRLDNRVGLEEFG